MDHDLGYFDDETCRLEPLHNPFGPKVLPHVSGIDVTYVSRIGRRGDGAQRRIRTTDTRIFSPQIEPKNVMETMAVLHEPPFHVA